MSRDMLPEWFTAAGAIIGATVVPMGGLLLWLHDRNTKARRLEEKARRKRFKRLFLRLDHLDDCVDNLREWVASLEGQHRKPGRRPPADAAGSRPRKANARAAPTAS